VTARPELVDAAVDVDASRLVALFKDLHRHPEPGFAETRTAGIVAAELAELGFAVTTGICGTGVVAVLHNGRGPRQSLQGQRQERQYDVEQEVAAGRVRVEHVA